MGEKGNDERGRTGEEQEAEVKGYLLFKFEYRIEFCHNTEEKCFRDIRIDAELRICGDFYFYLFLIKTFFVVSKTTIRIPLVPLRPSKTLCE